MVDPVVKSLKGEVGPKMGIVAGKLVLRLDQQNAFKVAANQLVGKVGTAIQTLNQNQAQQQSIVTGQQNKVADLIEQTKKLITQRSDSSRELGKQQPILRQQFVQMEQWKAEAEPELLVGKLCQ